MTGAQVLLESLKSLGVQKIFAITGAGNLAIIDSIVTDGSIQIIYSHHEQAAVMEAQGYSRVTGDLGVALVTTGGGTSNAVTGVLGAHLDSIPILLISGNESSFHCANSENLRAYGVQGFDSVAVLNPIVKSSRRINETTDIGGEVRNLAALALKDRMGPVHLDFPMDLQRKVHTYSNINAEIISFNEPPRLDLKSLVERIKKSKKPLIYIGNGARNSMSLESLKEIIQILQIPFAVSWSAIDILPEMQEYNIGRIGIYGDRAANIALQKSDLVICIGTRLAIPQVGYDKKDFGRKANKWVVDIDLGELEKFKELGWNLINSDSGIFSYELLKSIRANTGSFQTMNDWLAEITELRNVFPRMDQIGEVQTAERPLVHSASMMNWLNENLAEDATICTDVGAALLTGHYILEPSTNRRIFTSQGLGEMGFGLPGAIGAYFAQPDKQIICLNTDGAIMFNMQELQVVKEHKLPLKLFIFNNNGYSMIKISQDNLFNGRMAGSTPSSGISFPNFEDLAKLFGLKYLRIENIEDQSEEVLLNLNSGAAVLLEVIMSPEQKYLPRLATNKLSDGTLVSPPLEDLDPKISLDELEKALGYRAHTNSYKARGLEIE